MVLLLLGLMENRTVLRVGGRCRTGEASVRRLIVVQHKGGSSSGSRRLTIKVVAFGRGQGRGCRGGSSDCGCDLSSFVDGCGVGECCAEISGRQIVMLKVMWVLLLLLVDTA